MSEPGQVLERDHPQMTAVTNYDSAVIRSLDCDTDVNEMQAIILEYTILECYPKFQMSDV